jgi:hypothetical protein
MAKRLAFMTIGILKEPFGHPVVQGFIDRLGGVYEAAESTEGFIDRSRRDMESFTHSWGSTGFPECYAHIEDPKRLAFTLSLWDDLESVAAFAYHGPHGEAMTLRKNWFVQNDLPEQVAWWVEDDTERLDRNEAVSRLDALHKNGASPFAFNLKSPFDADGNPCKLDTAKVKAKAAAYAS